ncbi:unnamed protein product, partial [Prorocentrum cordatum]
PSGPRRASTLSLLAGPGAPRGGRAPPPPCPPSLVSLDRGGLAPCCCRVAQGSLEADGLGHPLEWTALHRQYQELFDAQLEGFLAAEGVPREAFVALARSLSRARADYRTGWDAFLAEITASSDYGGFVALMRAAAEARRAEEFEASMSVEMAEVARDPAPDPRG